MKRDKKVIVRTALCAVLVGALGYSFVAKSETKLIPFQGKLTDASGQVISDGAIVVQFKMYDAPVGGQAKWNGEVQMLSVNGGLVNTTLGTKASLKNVDFSSPTYLEITIDANGDNQIGPEDPPLLPRQSIIPAVYAVQAGDAKTLSGYDWSAIFGSNDPTGKIPGGKLANKSIKTELIDDNAVTAAQVANGAITSTKLADGAVTSIQLAKNSVTTDKLTSGAVTSDRLAEKAVTTGKIAERSITTELMGERAMVDASKTTAPIGSVARSSGIATASGVGSHAYSVNGDIAFNPTYPNNPQWVQMPGLSLKLKTSGRPVMLMLQHGHFDIAGYLVFQLKRNDTYIDWAGLGLRPNNGRVLSIPSESVITCIDTPPAGEHTYSVWLGNKENRGDWMNCWGNPILVAFEL